MIEDIQQDVRRPLLEDIALRTGRQLRIAYLVNQYPKVSHTFIRREILATERLGLHVERLALRGWDEKVVDARDEAERPRTRFVLKDGLLPLIGAAARQFIRQPKAFARALAEAAKMSRRSTRSLPYHLVYVAQASRIKEMLDETPVDHLHAHFGTNSTEIARFVSLLGGPTYSFTVHGSNEADDGKYLHLDRKVRDAKFVVAVSAYTRSQLLRHAAPEDWHKVHVVHCGLDRESFNDTAQASSSPIFLCIGRLSPEKGHLILLDGFRQVTLHNPEARLVIVGDGPLRSLLEQRIRDLGLESHVRITGWISGDAVREEILACRVLVQPSFQEGLPVVIMEAMALGRPVISTYVAGIPELVVRETGWLVPAGDAQTLADAMEHSVHLPDAEIRRMGAAAHDRARARHSIDQEAAKLAVLFAEPS
ncbi:glycosyltransferase [Leptospira interrogans]